MAGNKEKEFYIYIDKTDDGRVFYVGKGRLSRIKKVKRNKKWCRIANKYGWIRVVLFGTKDESYAFEMEKEIIFRYKTFEKEWIDGSGWGANFTVGGEGTSGFKHSKRSRMKMAERKMGELSPCFGKRGNQHPAFGHIGHFSGKKLSQEHRRKISMAHTGIIMPPFSLEHRENIASAKLGNKNPNSKLTEEKVRQIRTLYSTDKISHAKLGKMFNISGSRITLIINGKSWGHVK